MAHPHGPLTFVIVTNSFDDRSGGIIALHLLCERLAEAGQIALLWPTDRPRLQVWRNPRRYLGWLRYHLTRRHRLFSRGPFATKLANSRNLAGAVVVYPEVIAGNPLRARHVVRWLLHKPGFHMAQVDYGSADLFFYYQAAFYDPALGDYKDNRLALTWWNKEYARTNHGERSGSCYLVRKGEGRPITHDLQNSVLIDTLTHREKAAVFNQVKYFYSYDPYTLYARYAAMCGCIPIIVPQPGVSRDQWVPYEEERYGLAYGDEEIGWAVATHDTLLRQITRDRETEDTMLRGFIEKCYARFA